VNKLDLSLEDMLIMSNSPVTIAASGVKVHNSGDWIRRIWKVKKGYLKVAVDIKQIVAIDYHLKRFMTVGAWRGW
jgi:hypothetical protein